GFFNRCAAIRLDGSTLLVTRDRVDKLMFRREHHECRTVERIRTSSVDSDLFVAAIYGKANFRTLALTDPVALHRLDLVRPVEIIDTFEKWIGIIRNLEKPLLQA